MKRIEQHDDQIDLGTASAETFGTPVGIQDGNCLYEG